MFVLKVKSQTRLKSVCLFDFIDFAAVKTFKLDVSFDFTKNKFTIDSTLSSHIKM